MDMIPTLVRASSNNLQTCSLLIVRRLPIEYDGRSSTLLLGMLYSVAVFSTGLTIFILFPSVDPFSKKDWYDVKAPSMFNIRQIGKTVVTKTTGTSKISLLSKRTRPRDGRGSSDPDVCATLIHQVTASHIQRGRSWVGFAHPWPDTNTVFI